MRSEATRAVTTTDTSQTTQLLPTPTAVHGAGAGGESSWVQAGTFRAGSPSTAPNPGRTLRGASGASDAVVE